MSTDFFDSDLRSDTRVPPTAAGSEERVGRAVGDTISGRAISRLVEQKQERTNQMAGAVQEIELLRQRQRELEKEKEALETLTRKQESYEHDKRDITEKLERCLVVFEKQSAEAMRAADLIVAVGRQFQSSLQEIRDIQENAWEAGQFDAELNKAIALVEQAKEQYQKGMSKVNATSWLQGAGSGPVAEVERAAGASIPVQGFGFWVKAGLGFSLPLIVALAAGFVVWLLVTGALL